MRLGVTAPDHVIDVTGCCSATEITAGQDGGLTIGAGVRNSHLASHPLVRERYPVLARAVLNGASGVIRNAATTGREPAGAHPLPVLPGCRDAL